MNIHFRTLIEQLRTLLGTRRYRRAPARRYHDNSRLRSFRPQVERLEERNTPSTSSAQTLQIYHTLEAAADHIVIAVQGAAQSALANSQTIQQAIGPAF